MMFGIKAMFSDHYLVDLKKKTLRGLEGQAERGYSTGGLPLGYTSRPVFGENPREPIGYEILICEQHAEIVRRIFCLYRDGHSYLRIAETLNSEGIATPRHQRKGHRAGWVASTIREILRNEAYIGTWRFMQKEWRKLPGTNRRQYRWRSPDEVKVYERPHLRIVDQELWDAVAVRMHAAAERYTKGNVRAGHPARKTSYPLSGLIVCAQCLAPMVIVGGSSARYYRCGDAHKRGTCANKTPLREDLVTQAVIDHVTQVLASDELAATLGQEAEDVLAESVSAARAETERLTRDGARADAESLVETLKTIDATTEPGAFKAVSAALDRAVAQKEALDARLAEVRQDAAWVPRVPTDAELAHLASQLGTYFREDPMAAREVLRQMTYDRKIVLEPQPDGGYVAHSFLLPLNIPAAKTRKPRGRLASGASVPIEVVYNGGCAGRI